MWTGMFERGSLHVRRCGEQCQVRQPSNVSGADYSTVPGKAESQISVTV